MKGICDKCNRLFMSEWKSGVTYEGIDKHHNPPEFISDFFKEEWSGEFYRLCRKCHRDLHDEILIILNKHSTSFKFIKSEHWVMKKMTPKTIRESQKEIYDFTKKWIKENDTPTTST